MHTQPSIQTLLFNRIIQFILEPFFFILIGLIYALHYTSFLSAPTFILFLFLFVHQIIERSLAKTPEINPVQFAQLHPIFEGIQVLMLMYYFFNVSFLSFVLLLLYSLAIHSQFYSRQFFSKIIPISLIALLKTLVPNVLIFYVHLRFIPVELFWMILPLLFPLILIQARKWPNQIRIETQEDAELILTAEQQDKINPHSYLSLPIRRILIALCFLIGVPLLWILFSWFSLLGLLLVLLARPIVRSSTTENLMDLRLFFFGWVTLISLLTFFIL
ncbi:hypothetical protein [Lacticigenium naphthae]|uniref:hypothetical protein n=1 Tax=Lacticigenium naphthae TaxID=515351 RepID=UPI00040173F6|nr:hypothetical protein [Lacticigenium naphthae]